MTTTNAATHEVIRPIPGSEFKAGDQVDASSWRNREKLERTRYLRPIEDVTTLRARAERAEARVVELEAQLAQLTRGRAAGSRR